MKLYVCILEVGDVAMWCGLHHVELDAARNCCASWPAKHTDIYSVRSREWWVREWDDSLYILTGPEKLYLQGKTFRGARKGRRL